MNNVFYMFIGVLLYVLGSYGDIVKNHLSALLERSLRDKQVEHVYCDETVYSDDFNDDNVNTYEQKVTVFEEVEKAPPVPPQTDEIILHDYVPNLYEDVDVEIMTPERERELYARAKLGGV